MAETTTNFPVLRHTSRNGANDGKTAPLRRNEVGQAAAPDMNGAEASEAAGTPLQRLSASPGGAEHHNQIDQRSFRRRDLGTGVITPVGQIMDSDLASLDNLT